MKRPICRTRVSSPRLRFAAILAGLGLAGASALHAADGTWNKPGGSWIDINNWASGTIADGTGATAHFGTFDLTADGGIVLNGARTIGHLIFGDLAPSHNWFLDTGSGGPLTLDVATGAATITVNNQITTINALLAGDDVVTKDGAGTLVLTNVGSTLSGDFNVNAGILRIAGSGGTTSSIGVTNIARNLNIAAGATVQFANHDAFGSAGANPALVINVNGGTISNVGFNSFTTLGLVNLTNGTITSGGGANAGFQAFHFRNTVTSSGNSALTTTGTPAGFNGFHVTNNTFNVVDGTLTVSAPLINATSNGLAGFTKSGAGTMVLSAANSFTGNTLVTGGTLQVAAGGSLPGVAKVVANSGASIIVDGLVTVANAGEFNIGGGITDTTGSMTINAGGVVNVGGGGGYATLGGRNSFGNAFGAGTLNMNGGTLNIAAPGTGSSGPGGLDATSFWLNPYGAGPTSGGSIINLDAGTLSAARPVSDGGSGVSRLRYNGGTFQAAGNISSNLVGIVRNGGARFDTGAFSLAITGRLEHSAIAGDAATDGGLTKTGTGTLTLSAANTFNGNIVVNQGTLAVTVGANSTAPTASGLGNLSVARVVTVNAGATLIFNAADAIGRFDYATPVTFVADGGTISHGNTFMAIGNVELKNGGTLTGGNGLDPVYSGFALNGSLTVSGTGRATLSATGATNPGTNLGSATTPFIVGSTGAVGGDLLVTSPLLQGPTGNLGGIVKSGPGTMVLNYAGVANLYAGNTRVDAGTLLVNNALNSATAITVADGAGFGRNAGGTLTIASLALTNHATLSAFGSADNATTGSIVVSNADGFTAPGGAGTVTVNVGGSLAVGTTYTLLNYTGTFAGPESTFVLGAQPARTLGSLALNLANSSLDYTVTGVDSARWSGAASSDWSTAVLNPTTNWVVNSNGTPTNYLATDNVSFTDSAANTAVTINSADVTPGSVIFNNTAKNYTLSGSRAITGGTSLVKSGTGSLTISNVNTYTGGTQLNGGLVETVSGGLGTSGTITFDGGSLKYATGNTQDISGRIANSTGPVSLDTNGNNLTFSGLAASNTGGLVKSGAGNITITSTGGFTGDIVINGGGLINNVGANNANPTATGLGNMTIPGRKITINAGASLTFGVANDSIGQYNYKTPVTFVVDGGTLSHGNQFVTVGDIHLKNGGTITGNNGVDPRFSGFNIVGSVTVSGTGPSFLSTTGTVNPGTNLGTEANPNVIFNIGNTGAVGGDFIVTSPLLWEATAHSSGVIKTGPGTMLLNYATVPNLYPGATVIDEGSIIVNGALNPVTTVSVGDGAGFGRTSGGAVTVASLALTNHATLSVAASPANAATGSIIVTGADAFTAGGAAGSVTVNVGGGGLIPGSTYTLVDYAGTFAGAANIFTLGSTPVRTLGNLVINSDNGSLDFAVTSVDSLRWTGAASSQWSTDVLTPTKNFLLQSNSSPTDFLANDSVTFNDTAVSKTVNINSADVTIGAVKFDHSTAYTLAGSKGMAGPGALTKTGSGTLTITNVNSHTGGTAINEGTINVVAGALGTAGPVSFGGGTLQYASGNTQDISSRLANSASAVKLDTNGNDVTFAGLINATNTGGLEKSGAGTLILANTGNAFTGDLVVNGGTVAVTTGLLPPAPATTALGNPNVARQVVINAGARLELRQHDILGNDAANPLITFVVNGGTLAAVAGSQASGNGPFNILPAVTLNGGTLTSTNGAFDPVQSLSLKGTITVTGSTPSVINTTGTPALSNGIHLTQTGGNIFDVADVTASSAVDLDASARFINRASNLAPAGLIKRGAGTMSLSNAANAYTGDTSVEAGTLLLAGSISGSVVTVSNAATFGGSGTIKGLLVNPDGIFSPSAPATPGLGIGTVTASSDAALLGTTIFDLAKSGSTLSSDLLVSTTLVLYGGNLNISFTGDALAAGDRFNLFDAPNLSGGTFAAINLPSPGGALQWDTTQLGVDGTIAVVPEPASALLLLGGLGLVAGFRRRRAC